MIVEAYFWGICAIERRGFISVRMCVGKRHHDHVLADWER